MKFDSIFFFLPSLITRPALCEKELHWNIVKETKRVECCSTFSLVEKRASADSIFRQHSNSFFFSPRKGHPLFLSVKKEEQSFFIVERAVAFAFSSLPFDSSSFFLLI